MALDYGQVRIGMAVSDPLRMFAKPLKTIPNQGRKKIMDEIKSTIEEQQASLLVIGMPWAIDGSDTPMTIAAKAFAQKARAAFAIPVQTWDERYSSAEAEAELKRLGYSWRESRDLRDAMAAAMILKSWLEARA